MLPDHLLLTASCRFQTPNEGNSSESWQERGTRRQPDQLTNGLVGHAGVLLKGFQNGHIHRIQRAFLTHVSALASIPFENSETLAKTERQTSFPFGRRDKDQDPPKMAFNSWAKPSPSSSCWMLRCPSNSSTLSTPRCRLSRISNN